MQRYKESNRSPRFNSFQEAENVFSSWKSGLQDNEKVKIVLEKDSTFTVRLYALLKGK